MDDAAEMIGPSGSALSARLMRRAAERAVDRPEFMAWVLARYRAAERIDEDRLAVFLGISREVLDRVAVCGRPRPELFKEDVEAIAERFGVTVVRLVNLIREVEVLEAFAPMREGSGAALAAARDRIAEEPGAYDDADDDGAPGTDANRDESDDRSTGNRR